MDFPFPFIDVLVIPTDAGPGDGRIVLDGINGTIQIFDDNGDLIVQLDPVDPPVEIYNPTSGASIKSGLGIEVPSWDIATGDVAETAPAHFSAVPRGAGGTRQLSAFMRSPSPNICGIEARGTSVDTTVAPEIILGATDNTALEVTIGPLDGGKRIGRGIIAQQVLTTDNGPHSADATTDMALSNIPVIAGHTYAIHVHSACQLAGAAASRWIVNLFLNGVVFDRIDDFHNLTAATLNGVIDGTVYWTPSTTQATDDIDVRLDEISGTQTFELFGGGPPNRTLTVTDLGATT